MTSKTKKTNILIYIIIALGIFLRLAFITRFPAGLNCDEASSSYEAYSILTTLRDRNNYFLPVYLVSWGGGQSVLLTYLGIPFVKLLGLNVLATRLPMAIISSISVIVFYKLILLLSDEDSDNQYIKILFAVLFFALNPWHIMKSRWALDANLLPDFVLFGIYFIIKFIKSKTVAVNPKERFLYIGFILLAISAYAYSTAYVALTIFTIIFFIYSIIKKCVNVKMTVCTASIVLLMTWPLILFVIINIFDLNEINLAFLSIPKLRVNRLLGESVGGNSNIFLSVISNLINEIKFIVFQDDGLYWNRVSGIGMYYLFSFPLLIIGFVRYVIDKKPRVDICGKDVMFIWLVSGLIMCLFLKEININRANFVIIPIIYFIIEGFSIFNSAERIKAIPFIVLIIGFMFFSYRYIDSNLKKEKNILIDGYNTGEIECFAYGFDKLIPHLDDETKYSKVYLFGMVHEAHIFVLYYTKCDPQLFYNQKVTYSDNKKFNNIKQFGKWNFGFPEYLENDERIAYVTSEHEGRIFKDEFYNKTKFGNYIIATLKTN